MSTENQTDTIRVVVADDRPSGAKAIGIAVTIMVVAIAILFGAVLGVGNIRDNRSEESLRKDFVAVAIAIEGHMVKFDEYPAEVKSSDSGLFVTLDNKSMMDRALAAGNAVEFYIRDSDSYRLCLSGNRGLYAYWDSSIDPDRVMDHHEVGDKDVCRS